MAERLDLISNLPPVLRAYTFAYHGVELLKEPLESMARERTRVSLPWTGPVREMVLAEQKFVSSITFYSSPMRQQADMFTNDLASLAGAMLTLHRYCKRPEYDALSYQSCFDHIKKAGDRSQAAEDYKAKFDAVIEAFRQQLAPVRQTLALCRYTAREMYPDHFGMPTFEQAPEVADAVAAKALTYRIAEGKRIAA